MPKKAGIVIMIAGAVLIIAALSLFLYNRQEDAQAGQAAESLLREMQSMMDEKHDTEGTTDPSEEPEETTKPIDPEMTVVEIDGYGYIGYLSIPVLELELPVMSEWDYTRLKIAPCRQFGSTKTDDLVIAGHNYAKHFGPLSGLQAGDTVLFTDMDGDTHTYEVLLIDTLNPTAVDEVQNSGYDLVLYTCTYGGKTRVTVFCDRPETADEETENRSDIEP